MSPELNNWLQLIFRWAHVIAGITWIGHLYFFNWVNGPFQAKIDGSTKKIVTPELLPRALFWFRWGAAWTWIFGILLGVLVYYQSREVLFDSDYLGNQWLWFVITLIVLAVGFVVYNAVMKMVANKVAGATICMAIFVGIYYFYERVAHYSGRALYIHTGIIFGTMMALNVWMIIWPYQKRIITAVKEGTAPDPAQVAVAGLRSRHNTYMSVPLVFTMISNHYPTVYGAPVWERDSILAGIIIVGYFFVWLMYRKAKNVPGF